MEIGFKVTPFENALIVQYIWFKENKNGGLNAIKPIESDITIYDNWTNILFINQQSLMEEGFVSLH